MRRPNSFFCCNGLVARPKLWESRSAAKHKNKKKLTDCFIFFHNMTTFLLICILIA